MSALLLVCPHCCYSTSLNTYIHTCVIRWRAPHTACLRGVVGRNRMKRTWFLVKSPISKLHPVFCFTLHFDGLSPVINPRLLVIMKKSPYLSMWLSYSDLHFQGFSPIFPDIFLYQILHIQGISMGFPDIFQWFSMIFQRKSSMFRWRMSRNASSLHPEPRPAPCPRDIAPELRCSLGNAIDREMWIHANL